MLFADFDNDTIGDVVVGFDDDGDAGAAWLYPGEGNRFQAPQRLCPWYE